MQYIAHAHETSTLGKTLLVILARLVDAVGELRENFIRDVMRYIRVAVGEVQLLISLANPPLRLGQIAPPLCIRLLLQCEE